MSERAIFVDLVRAKGSSGDTRITYGQFAVIVDQIPETAPQDWPMGPKQAPGSFGAYREHLFYPAGHGPYAFAVGKTAAEAKSAAASLFRRPLVNLEPDPKRPARALWEATA